MKGVRDIHIRFTDNQENWFYLLARIGGRRFGCVSAPDMSMNQLSEMVRWLEAALDRIEGRTSQDALEWVMDGEPAGFFHWALCNFDGGMAELAVGRDSPFDRDCQYPLLLSWTRIDAALFIRRFWKAFRAWGEQSRWTGLVATIAAERRRRRSRHERQHRSGFYDRQMARHGHSLGAPDLEPWMKVEKQWREVAHMDPASYHSHRLDRLAGLRCPCCGR